MTAVQEIQAAINVLIELRDQAEEGPWMFFNDDEGGSERGDLVMGDPSDPAQAYPVLGRDIYRSDAALIVTLHRTIDARLLEKLDDFEPPRCENTAHVAEPDHHSGDAAFLFISPCGHGTGYVCAPFVQWILRDPMVMCGTCDLHCAPSELTFIPIGGTS